MHEIRQLTGHGLDYLSVEELQALLSPGFDILHAEEEVISLPFPTPQAVLKHLKQTGVTGTEKGYGRAAACNPSAKNTQPGSVMPQAT